MDRFTINENLIRSLWDRFDCSDAAELNVQVDGASFTIRRYSAAAAGRIDAGYMNAPASVYAKGGAFAAANAAADSGAPVQSTQETDGNNAVPVLDQERKEAGGAAASSSDRQMAGNSTAGSMQNKDSESAGSTQSADTAVSAQLPGAGDAKRETSDNSDNSGNSSNSTYVRSPLPGTFYRAASPAEEPFVTPGTQIHKGDVIGIVESMKMMNEITSEADGIVAEILAEDGSMVGYDEKLIRLEKINV